MGTQVTSKPIWVAFRGMDDNGTYLRSGEPLVDIAQLI